MAEPNLLRQRKNEREVTDPVTHLPLVVHDQELDQVLEHNPGMSLDRVLEEELQSRWSLPEIESRTRMQTAIVATVVTASGGPAGVVALWAWSKLPGLALFAGVCGSLLLSVLVGGCVLFLPLRLPLRAAVPADLHSPRQSPETALWLNSLLHSLWPIVNPAIFTSISDMLEDALQASLPSFVHGVHVADIGQGSEPMRILGIRWLDSGRVQTDLFNVEVAVAYRARNKRKRLRKNAHLLVEFLVPAGVVIPMWVELTGLLATARMRIELMPNPPFFALCTLTLLGQPKITIACTPLAKNFLNLMNIPLLSDWLQKIIDGVVAEYVAPRSLTLDLKTMLMGQEKKDTHAEGVLVVTVKSAKGFSGGDNGNIFATKDARKGDTYVQVGWAKWGKPLWSTRVVKNDGHPVWQEMTALLVGPAETNANESLRLQLWDSDLFTADDALGIVDFPLKDIMIHSTNCFSAHESNFTGTKGKPRRGTLSWECGYFSKTTLEQHLAEKYDDIKGILQHIKETAEIKQQYSITASPPKDVWPSGIIRIEIEKIEGLAIGEGGEDDDDDEAGDLPSPYCTIMINHQKVYKTRTKMKSSNPFYNSTTEKFIRDWRTTTIMISARDARTHETHPHPLLGIIVLPLQHLFTNRRTSHITDTFPLTGGTAHGRIRVSLTFRSVQLRLPPALLGWDVGTLEIAPHVRAPHGLPLDLVACRLVFRTTHGAGKMRAHGEEDGDWDWNAGWRARARGGASARCVRLAVTRRYASCLVVEFRKQKHRAVVGVGLVSERTPAFAVLWLRDVPDDEDVDVPLVVWKNGRGRLARAEVSCVDDGGGHGGSGGEKVGEIVVRMRMRRGIGSCHREAAGRDVHVKEVMEVLRCVAVSGVHVDERDAFEDEHRDDSSGGEDSGGDDSEMHGKQQHPSLIEKMGAKIIGTFEHHAERDFGYEKEV